MAAMLSAACRVLCESLRQPEGAGHHAVDPPTEVVHCYICYMQLCIQVQGYPPSVGPMMKTVAMVTNQPLYPPSPLMACTCSQRWSHEPHPLSVHAPTH